MATKINVYIESDKYINLKYVHTYPYTYCYIVSNNMIITNKCINRSEFMDAYVIDTSGDKKLCVFEDNISDITSDIKRAIGLTMSYV